MLTCAIIIIGFIAGSYAVDKVIDNSNTQKQASSNSPKPSGNTVYVPPREVSYEEVRQIILANQMIKDMPEKAALLLRFYNFNTGERTWEQSFILRTNSVEPGVTEADITIVIHSKYKNYINPNNLCNIIKTAKANDDLGIWTELSTTKLLWKFKSMTKYRDCLGF